MPFCSQNAHIQKVLVRCAQSRAASATPSKRSIRNQKALARVNGTSRRASGWAGENVARSGGTHPGQRKTARTCLIPLQVDAILARLHVEYRVISSWSI